MNTVTPVTATATATKTKKEYNPNVNYATPSNPLLRVMFAMRGAGLGHLSHTILGLLAHMPKIGPSLGQLAEEMGVSRRTAINDIQALAELGLVRVYKKSFNCDTIENWDGNSYKHFPNHYAVVGAMTTDPITRKYHVAPHDVKVLMLIEASLKNGTWKAKMVVRAAKLAKRAAKKLSNQPRVVVKSDTHLSSGEAQGFTQQVKPRGSLVAGEAQGFTPLVKPKAAPIITVQSQPVTPSGNKDRGPGSARPSPAGPNVESGRGGVNGNRTGNVTNTSEAVIPPDGFDGAEGLWEPSWDNLDEIEVISNEEAPFLPADDDDAEVTGVRTEYPPIDYALEVNPLESLVHRWPSMKGVAIEPIHAIILLRQGAGAAAAVARLATQKNGQETGAA